MMMRFWGVLAGHRAVTVRGRISCHLARAPRSTLNHPRIATVSPLQDTVACRRTPSSCCTSRKSHASSPLHAPPVPASTGRSGLPSHDSSYCISLGAISMPFALREGFLTHTHTHPTPLPAPPGCRAPHAFCHSMRVQATPPLHEVSYHASSPPAYPHLRPPAPYKPPVFVAARLRHVAIQDTLPLRQHTHTAPTPSTSASN